MDKLVAVLAGLVLVGGIFSYVTDDAPNNPPEEVACEEIKGNISSTTGEKIYHLPGDKFYSATTIDEAGGEKWFCTEDEAIDAGWRHSEW